MIDTRFADARNRYEIAAENHTEFAKLVDDCFDAMSKIVKRRTNIFKGDDRAENLVSAIAHYLIECEHE